jgi:hypothetical protein
MRHILNLPQPTKSSLAASLPRLLRSGSYSPRKCTPWGAYGNAPNDADPGPYNPNAPPDQQFRSPVHCVKLADDGLVYVCDRANDRIQVFTRQGKFIKEFFFRTATQGLGSTADIVFSRDRNQEYLLVADHQNGVIWTLQRSDGTALVRLDTAVAMRPVQRIARGGIGFGRESVYR